ncbi:MAG TPA: Ig-like domain-containing protein, partial [Verrucomicrobiae bacterium]|nr:Ig-like domain-containing protein [Verrucomicrobiae bacterium]
MKAKMMTLVFLFAFTCLLRAQPADDYVAWGRAGLADTNIPVAYDAFAHALALDINHPTANALFAITRLLNLPGQPAESNLLSRAGVPVAGRDIYNWTALLPTDPRGKIVLPAGLNGSEFSALVRTNLLLELIGAEGNLAKITDTNFLLTLSASETRSTAVSLDYGDIQLLRALLKAAQYASYTACAYNMDADLAILRSLITNQQFTVGGLLMDYPNLMTFTTTNDLTLAESAFQRGVDLYNSASRIIRNRPAGVVRLFNYDPEMMVDEQNFRQTLTDLTNSFTDAVPLTVASEYTVFLGSYFTGKRELRNYLPEIIGNGFVLGTLPDITFGGIAGGLSASAIETMLARNLQPIPSLSPVNRSGTGVVSVPLHVQTGRGYVVQVSTNLTSWQDGMAFVASANTVVFSNSVGAGVSRCFYRLVDISDAMPAPLNDNFENRVILAGQGITTTGYTGGSTSQTNEPDFPYSMSVWYQWTAPVSGTFVISTRALGPSGYTYANTYAGSTLTELALVAYDGHPFQAGAGTTYQIQVNNGGNPPGGFSLTITLPPVLAVAGLADGSGFTAPTNITISASATDGDGSISGISISGDENLLGSAAQSSYSLTWSNVPPGNHYVEVAATDNLGVTTISNLTFNVFPANDNFANSITNTGTSVTVYGSNRGASKEGNEPNHGGMAGGSSVWWSWIAPSNGPAVVSVWLNNSRGQPYGTPLLGIYTGNNVSSLTEVAGAAAPYPGGQATTNFTAMAGTTYRIAVDERNGYQANITMNWIQPPAEKVTVIELGVATNNLSGDKDSLTYYYLNIPPGIQGAGQIWVSGGTGDCDLYVRQGSRPTLTEWDYRPYL